MKIVTISLFLLSYTNWGFAIYYHYMHKPLEAIYFVLSAILILVLLNIFLGSLKCK